MENTYTWRILNIVSLAEHQGQKNVVTAINWHCIAKNGLNTVFKSDSTEIPFDPNAEFTPYDQLTKDKVMGWLQSTLGTAGIANVESALSEQLAKEAIGPTVLPNPWGA